MNMVCPNEGKVQFLRFAFGLDSVGTLQLDLYQNDYTGVDASVLADFDISDFTGYGSWTLNGADWDSPIIVSDVGQMDTLLAPSFTCTGGSAQTAYGWYLHYPFAGVVLLTQRFDTPRLMTTGAVETLDPFRVKLKTFA